MKIIAKIETPEALKNLDAINAVADSIAFVFDKIESEMETKWLTQDWLIQKIKNTWKPVIVTYISDLWDPKYPLRDQDKLKEFCSLWVDGYALEWIIKEDDTFDIITEVYEELAKHELELKEKDIQRFDNDEISAVRDYIIFNAYRITKELDIKAIVCFTENGWRL